MPLDSFELRIDPVVFVPDPARHRYLPVEIWINGRLLLDFVQPIEHRHLLEEYRLGGGEADGRPPPDPNEVSYHHLPAGCVLLPRRNLLGEPWPHGFVLDPNDPRNRKSAVLGCTCGIIECWFLQALITIGEEVVTWSDFGQFHRDWRYDLGPFVFGRSQYESELVKQPSELVSDPPARIVTHR